jgi:hypothetical protein
MMRPSLSPTARVRFQCALFRVALCVLIAIGAPLLAQSAASSACPAARSTSATIGVGAFVCYGGNCILFDRTPEGPSHTFTVEPILRGVPANGPAAGKLLDGDIIIAIDDALITTVRAGRKLAAPVVGRPLRFRVRRSGRETEAVVVPAEGCETPGIAISDSPEAEARARETIGRMLQGVATKRSMLRPAREEEIVADFGMTLDCVDCGWRVPLSGGPLAWHAARPPRVTGVEPAGPAARAGVRVGDLLDTLDGAPFAGGEESPVWGALRAGTKAVLIVHRGSKMLRLEITPRHPARQRM